MLTAVGLLGSIFWGHLDLSVFSTMASIFLKDAAPDFVSQQGDSFFK